MKKLKVLLVASSLFLSMGLAGCGTTTKSSSTTPISDSTSTDSTDYATLAKQALAQVATSLSKYATVTGVSADFALIVKSTVVAENGKSYEFDIVYSVATDYASSLAISTDGTKCLVTPENTVDGGVDHKCKLHADAKINGEVKASEDFNILVKAITKYTIEKIYTLAKTGDSVVVYGKVTGFYGTNYIVNIGDGNYGLSCFKFTAYDGMAIGDYVKAAGTVSPYSGLMELSPTTITKSTAAEAGITEPTALAYNSTNAVALTANQAGRQITLEGAEVTSVAGTGNNDNVTVTAKLNGAVFTLFFNPTYVAAADYATLLQTRTGATAASIIQQHDIISISGQTSVYTNPQIVGAKITSWTEATVAPDAPVSITLAKLSSGEAWDTTKKYVTQGFVTGVYGGSLASPKNGLFIADGTAGLDIYGWATDASAFPVGTCVTVTGTPTVFNGLIEFTASSIVATATADITASTAVQGELAGVTGLSTTDISRQVHVTGILQDAVTPVYGTTNATAKLTIGNNETLSVYLAAKSKWISSDVVSQWAAFAKGDEIELTGFIGNYNKDVTDPTKVAMTGVQIVNPTVVSSKAAAAIVPLTPTMTVAGAVAAAKGAAVDTIGFYEGAYKTNMYAGVFFGDGVNSIVTYKGANFPMGLVKGTPIHVVGSAAPFNGLPEIDISAGSIVALPKALVATTVLATVAKTGITAALDATSLNAEFDLTGAVIKTITKAAVAGTTDGSYVVTVGTIDVTLFVKKSGLEADVYTKLAAAKVGDTLAFTAFGGQYVSSGVATYQLVAPQGLTVTAA